MKATNQEINKIAKEFDLEKDLHIYYNREHNYTIITRKGILKIIKKLKLNILHDLYFHADVVVVKSKTTDSNHRVVEAFGEASPENNEWHFPIAIAEKRADARLILKLIMDEFEDAVFGEEEIMTQSREQRSRAESVINQIIG